MGNKKIKRQLKKLNKRLNKLEGSIEPSIRVVGFDYLQNHHDENEHDELAY